MERRPSIVQIILDILSLGLVFTPIPILEVVPEPSKRGFACVNGKVDPAISQPFHESTVSDVALLVSIFVIPIVLIIIGEALLFIRNADRLPVYVCPACFVRIPTLLWQLYKAIGYFLYGLAVTALITQIGKFTVGRLRPHFGVVCNPVLPTSCDGDFIENYVCNSAYSAAEVKETHVSFPSGHASLATYCAVFLSIYIQYRVSILRGLFRAFFQILFIATAFFVGVSRVMDNKHHPTDVLAGFIIGILAAIWMGLAVTRHGNLASRDIESGRSSLLGNVYNNRWRSSPWQAGRPTPRSYQPSRNTATFGSKL